MHTFSGQGWGSLVFACSLVLASAGATAGGGRGGDGGGHHDGGGSEKGEGGGKGERGGKSSGGHAGKGNHDARQDRAGKGDHRADRRPGKRSERRFGNSQKGRGGASGQVRPSDPSEAHSKGWHPGSKQAERALEIEAASTAATAVALAGATAIATSAVQARGERSPLELPATLQPRESTLEIPDESIALSIVNPIKPVPGVPDEVVRACQAAIETAAAPLGATDVRVSSAGSLRRPTPDSLSAPVDVSIDYSRQGGIETRQSPVTCELNAAGTVTGLL